MMSKAVLPEELTMRPATREDIKNVYRLSRACDIAQYGQEEYNLDDIQMIWTGPGVNLAEDSLVVFDQIGRLVGSLLVQQQRYAKFYIGLRILPDYSDPRLGDHLLALAETWARVRMVRSQPTMRVTLNASLSSANTAEQACFTRAGLQEVRRFWRMEIELHEAPAEPVWPAGIELRPYVPGRDEQAVFEVIDTAFMDHWGHIPSRFEEWRHWTIERTNFDPTLWFVAYEGEQIVGGSFCLDMSGHGWVDDLAVLRPWRGKGLGMALLLYSFGEFYRRGQRKVGLGVDSQNLTGALRLYQRAGMQRIRENISYEKELRAGVELSTRVLVD
ncbi:MAG TPA: GNAT family N-acetyltransferase [Ktedonobacteraceae bacterium]